MRALDACVVWTVMVLGAGAGGALLPLEAERLRASVGGYAVMNCHLDFPFGNEIPYHLHWDKDGESVLSWYSGGGVGAGAGTGVGDRWGGRVRRLDDGRLGLGRGSINVSAVRETDAGLYRCRVTFPNRTPPARNDGTFYRLEVDGGNLIATPPVNVTVREGERAELECLPKRRGAPVEWSREGESLAALPELAARARLAPNGSLVIERAASTDPGEYSCRVTDGELAQTAAAYLDVQYAAKVVYAPLERYLPLGKPASLDCHFSANPPLTNLRWEKDGFLFDPYNVPGVFYSRNGSLLFNQVDESHEGQYSCTPYNALGTSGPSPRVHVRVLRPPALAVRPLPLYVARLGGSLTLPCALAAPVSSPEGGEAPRARLRWAREDGAPLPAGRHSVAGGNLTLMEVAPEDAGGYECRAEDDETAGGGGVAARTDLLVENAPPRAPDALRASPAATDVHLLWRPGEGGTAAEYTVWYRERAASEWRTMKILSRGVTEATVGGLRPGTEYEVRVLAQDLIGDGLFSKPLFVRTLAPEEADPPEDAGALEPAATDLPPDAGDRQSDELEVTVRLLEEGALVRWGGGGEGTPCTVRWYEGDRVAATATTRLDYLLVREVAEGGRYAARVSCGAATGRAALAVPEYSRLRGAAAAVAAVALLLAALAIALYLARRRLFSRSRPTRSAKRPR